MFYLCSGQPSLLPGQPPLAKDPPSVFSMETGYFDNLRDCRRRWGSVEWLLTVFWSTRVLSTEQQERIRRRRRQRNANRVTLRYWGVCSFVSLWYQHTEPTIVSSQVYQEVLLGPLSCYRMIMPNVHFFLVNQIVEGQKEHYKMKWRLALEMRIIQFWNMFLKRDSLIFPK